MTSIYNFSVRDFKDKDQALSQYKNKVLLIVNTASQCGFTPQYAGLEKLQQEFCNQGFDVLAFPCNQFKQQEKGSNAKIKHFCDLHFNISFALFAKVDVNGDKTEPLFTLLKSEAPGIFGSTRIKWNFTKFLINKQGKVVKRYAPVTKPESIRADIQALLYT